jgi:hypothetical protein|tara:strand:+ start:3327 stop:3749 length:423 start_codon:yes stop_codon:yes gene_type:complete
MEKSREQKMTEFYKRKVMRLEEKNDKLKFQISQIKDEKSDDILMRLYESEYGDKSEKRIIKGEDFLDNEVFIDDLISSVYYEKVRDFFVDYVMSNNPLPFNPMKLLKDMNVGIKVRKLFEDEKDEKPLYKKDGNGNYIMR